MSGPAGEDDTVAATLDAGDTRPRRSASDMPTRGDAVGRYLVLDRVGAGGMGVVLVAHDPDLDRKVALKLLKSSKPDDAQVRLRREAQALAKLDHPNVVAVHDVGEHQGQLFVAMEFVEGQTLRQWMAQVERPRPWPDVLEVFVAAGRGLAAAHAAGLVHRDFKPDNVMLGDDRRVRVMDFGLARAGEPGNEETFTDVEGLPPSASSSVLSNALTRTGAMMGTPAYMSPEQIGGQPADALSDQFSYCVALYKALWGVRPFEGSTVAAMFDAVLDGRVRVPPKGISVPSWVHKVILRGLATRPKDRFESMDALLDALLDDPAVRRRRWLLGASVMAAVAGLAWGASAELRREADPCARMASALPGVWDDARRAELRAAIEGTKLSYAASTSLRVEAGLDEWMTGWVEARTAACESNRDGAQSDELFDLRMACLDARLLEARSLVDVLARADAEVVMRATAAVRGLASVDRCADVEALTAEVPPPEDEAVAAQVAALDRQLAEAEALENAGKFAAGLELAATVDAEARAIDYVPLQARARLRLASLQEEVGDYQASVTAYEQTYDLALGAGLLPEAAVASRSLISVVGVALARHEPGRSWAVHAGPLARATGSERARADVLMSMAAIAESAREPTTARDLITEALAIYEQALGPRNLTIARGLTNLGSAERLLGDLEGAQRHLERSLQIQEEVLGGDHPLVALALDHLGAIAYLNGDHERALEHHQRALALGEAARGPDHPMVAQTLNNLAAVSMVAGDLAAAHRYGERALAIYRQALGAEHPTIGSMLNNLGEIVYQQGQLERARGYFERSLASWESTLGAEHPRLASPLMGLGKVLTQQGAAASAVPLLERALALRTSRALDPVEVAHTRFVLARALLNAAPSGARQRALEQAGLARQAFATAGERSAEDLARVDAWLAEVAPDESSGSATEPPR